jgi:hypothetical protein
MDYDLRLWSFFADMNGDGAVTISDVWLWFKWLYFYPGDGLLYAVMSGAPKIAYFFELSSVSYGGGFSGVVSFFAWLIVLGVLGAAADQT